MKKWNPKLSLTVFTLACAAALAVPALSRVDLVADSPAWERRGKASKKKRGKGRRRR